jgi:FkbM family methyltransferase
MRQIERLGLGEIKERILKKRLFKNQSIRYLANGSGWRFDTLLEKEPETIEWIESFKAGETLWDIGANVGIYSIYAAQQGINVVAFEPHFANYFQLCINIMLNNLQEKILPLCLALSDKKSVSTINLASIDFGTSMSSFGSNLDFRGNAFNPAFRQGMVGYDIDKLVTDFGLTPPNYFKIDVDGIELKIVEGGQRIFSDPAVKSISIELVDTDQMQVQSVTDILENAGLHFIHKKQNPAFATPQTKDVLNFLYRRNT